MNPPPSPNPVVPSQCPEPNPVVLYNQENGLVQSNSQVSLTMGHEMAQMLNNFVHHQNQHHQAVYADLTSTIARLEAQIESTRLSKSSKAVRSKKPGPPRVVQPSPSNKTTMSSSKKKRSSRAALAPPQTSTPNRQVSTPKAKAPLKPSSPAVTTPKRNPNQMQTADYPKAFATVKVSRASIIVISLLLSS